jgi:hypothetical protein
MNGWLRRIRGAVGLGLTWAVAWGFVGFGIELVHNIWPNPLGSMVDIWPAVLAYPAFLGGLAFSTVLGIAGRRRRFDELSLPRFAAWGALGGLLLGLVPAVVFAGGAASLAEVAATVSAIALLTAVSATGSLMLARMAEEGGSIAAGGAPASAGSRILEP